MDDGPVDRPRAAGLVPRGLGRDDGRDDVPVGRADGRAVLAHDQAAISALAAALRRPATWSPGPPPGWSPSCSRPVARPRRRRRARRGTARADGSPAATLLVAAVYELTPLKDVCLGKCRSPLGFLLGSWRDGSSGCAADGREERRLVRRLLLGADGLAVRARRHERRLDGRRRRADRRREDPAVAPGRDLRDGGACCSLSACCCSLRPRRSRHCPSPAMRRWTRSPWTGWTPWAQRARLVSCSGRGSRSRPAGTGPRGCRGPAPRRRPRRSAGPRWWPPAASAARRSGRPAGR